MTLPTRRHRMTRRCPWNDLQPPVWRKLNSRNPWRTNRNDFQFLCFASNNWLVLVIFEWYRGKDGIYIYIYVLYRRQKISPWHRCFNAYVLGLGEHQSVYLFSFCIVAPPWRLTNFNEQSLSFHWSIEGVLTCKAFPMNWLKTTISGGFFRYAHFFRVWWTTFSWVHPNRCFYDLYAWLTTEPHEELMKQPKKLRNRKARLYSTIYENCWSASAIKKVASTTTAGTATTYTLDVTTTPTWMI